MPIHSELQQLLTALPAIDLETITIEDLRAAANTPFPSVGSPEPKLAATEDRQVDTPHGSLTVRIHRPLSAGPTPTVMFFHGGGWTVGSPAAVSPLTERLSAYLGAVVVSGSYRLAPEHRFPAAYDDAYFLTRWAADHLDSLGGLPDAFVVAGESAGGNLAAAVALALREENILAGQLLLNPATNLSLDRRDTESYRADPDPGLTAINVEWSVQSYLGSDQSTDWRASPACAENLTGAPTALVSTAGNDPLRDDGLAYATKLAAAGVTAEAINFPDMIHGTASQAPVVTSANDALVQTCVKLRALMGWPEPMPHK